MARRHRRGCQSLRSRADGPGTGITLLISRGVQLLTASGDDLTASDDPTRKMMRQIAGEFAEYEKARLVSKLRHARERVRQEMGKREGRKPHGGAATRGRRLGQAPPPGKPQEPAGAGATSHRQPPSSRPVISTSVGSRSTQQHRRDGDAEDVKKRPCEPPLITLAHPCRFDERLRACSAERQFEPYLKRR